MTQTVRFQSKPADPQPSPESLSNRLMHGDCIDMMKTMPPGVVDLVVTDPPYLVNYRSRDNRGILNDRDDAWMKPAFAEIHRVLKPDSFMVSFYGWPRIEQFMSVWKQSGFRPVGHLVWPKSYASSSRYVRYMHEQAFLLAKGNPPVPTRLLDDIQKWHYSGNAFHPTQKSVRVIQPLIEHFSNKNDLVLDPFCGSGTTAVAARDAGRRYLAIEKHREYFQIAAQRLG